LEGVSWEEAKKLQVRRLLPIQMDFPSISLLKTGSSAMLLSVMGSFLLGLNDTTACPPALLVAIVAFCTVLHQWPWLYLLLVQHMLMKNFCFLLVEK
jgi:hypothetical protein